MFSKGILYRVVELVIVGEMVNNSMLDEIIARKFATCTLLVQCLQFLICIHVKCLNVKKISWLSTGDLLHAISENIMAKGANYSKREVSPCVTMS